MTYQIKPYTFNRAEDLGVKIRPSKTGNYKLDVFEKNGQLITRVGDRRYSDYPTYMEEQGKTVADTRRKLYKERHQKDRLQKGSRGYYADQLLW